MRYSNRLTAKSPPKIITHLPSENVRPLQNGNFGNNQHDMEGEVQLLHESPTKPNVSSTDLELAEESLSAAALNFQLNENSNVDLGSR